MQSPRNRNQAPRSRDVLGVPRLPPGRATVAVNRLRALHGRVHASAAPPPLRIMESLFGMLDHRVLVALCEAGVPDALHHPTSITDLADQLKVDRALLHRLCVFADTHGWLRLDRTRRVCPTRVTEFLHNDRPGGWRAWVDFAGGAEVVAAVQALAALLIASVAFVARRPVGWLRPSMSIRSRVSAAESGSIRSPPISRYCRPVSAAMMIGV